MRVHLARVLTRARAGLATVAAQAVGGEFVELVDERGELAGDEAVGGEVMVRRPPQKTPQPVMVGFALAPRRRYEIGDLFAGDPGGVAGRGVGDAAEPHGASYPDMPVAGWIGILVRHVDALAEMLGSARTRASREYRRADSRLRHCGHPAPAWRATPALRVR